MLLISLFATGTAFAQTNDESDNDSAAYIADIDALNLHLTDDHIDGRAIFTTVNGKLNITIAVTGLPANVMHQMHLHAFTTELHPQKAKLEESVCPPEEADKNGDGIISETRRYGGRAFLPFNTAPPETQYSNHKLSRGERKRVAHISHEYTDG